MIFSNIEIKTKGKAPSVFTKVYIDGKEIHGVRRIEYNNIAGDMPIVTMDFNALNVSIDSEFFRMRVPGNGEVKSIDFEEE